MTIPHSSLFLQIPSGDTCLRNSLHKQQSLPLRPIIPLVARISDQNASGAPPMTVREKTRLEKFRQLLSSHNTDLGEFPKALGKVGAMVTGVLRGWELLPSAFFYFLAALSVVHRCLDRSLLSEIRDQSQCGCHWGPRADHGGSYSSSETSAPSRDSHTGPHW